MRALFGLLALFLLTLPSALSLEFTVSVSSPSQVDNYDGDTINNKFSATITNNAGICDIICSWSTAHNTQGTGVKVEHDGKSADFDFETKAIGTNGVASYRLEVTCDRDTSQWNCVSSPESKQFGPFSFGFQYSGDGICQTNREKCAAFSTFLSAPNDCICSSSSECRPSSERGADNKGCATFCGNKQVEKQFETCSNCPDDVGKCDDASCFANSECEGKYCVHNKCSHLAYKVVDTFCDKNQGETCKNSASDCACGLNERCNPTGFCETFCGNGVCEDSERGKCKADCTWCGDGACQPDESCAACADDCGICKQPTKEEEYQRNIPVKNAPESVAQPLPGIAMKRPYVVGSAIGALALIALIIFWIWRKKKGKKTELKRCKNCKKKLTDSEAKFCHSCGHKI